MSIAHLCIGFHLEGEQGGLCELEREAEVELGAGAEHLQVIVIPLMLMTELNTLNSGS